MAYNDIINNASALYGVPSNILTNLIGRESSFDPNAVSSAGAMGLTQLMPGTAASLGVTDAFDPEQNIFAGASYLSQLETQFGNWRDALIAYNQGPTSLSKNGPLQSSSNYADSILGRAVSDSANPGSLADVAKVPDFFSGLRDIPKDFLKNVLTFANPVNAVTAIIGMILILIGGLMFVFPGTISKTVEEVHKHPELLVG